jgi:ketosteroid isomerase-like protein
LIAETEPNMSEQEIDLRTRETDEVMRRFHEAFDRHDPDALINFVAEDCIIENTNPAPNGTVHAGKAACLAVWQGLVQAPGTWFTREEVLAFGDRAIVRWRYHWGENADQSIRGVNLMRVRDGKVVEAMGYVKSG